jgi:hypothetical protein
MNKKFNRNRIVAMLLGLILTSLSTLASADPPIRVARLGYASGAVSFSPAGEENWVLAEINRPLVTGDRLWADADARAELQAGHAQIRMGPNTSVTLLNIDDRVTQLQLAQGSLNFRVQRLTPGEIFEVDTPNLAFTIKRPGSYRVDVDTAGNATTVLVRSGQGEVSGEGAAYVVDAQQSYRFAGTGLSDYQNLLLPPPDDFDHWSGDRDRRSEASVSARYVSPEVVGYEDLDDNGTWHSYPGYGNVWVPTHVAAGWSPYHDGHWDWVDPWGWTWVDDAPWGFAVSHYGRWASINGSWGWVPGPIAVRPVYAPALVVFVGGSNFSLSLSIGGGGGVAWFPLGPRDVYRPAYPVSRGYFTNINNSNTTINNTTITNVYNTQNVTNITYVNQTVPGAVTAVPAAAFAHSKPIAAAAVPVSKEQAANAQVMPHAAVAPTVASVSGAAAPAAHKPPPAVLAQPVVAKTAPPSPPVPFAAKQALFAANPGKPVEAKAFAAVRPATSAPAPVVTVVKSAPTSASPPPKPQVTPPAPGTAVSKSQTLPTAKPLEARPATSPANAPKAPEIKPSAPVEVPKPPEAKPMAPTKPQVAPPATGTAVPKSQTPPTAKPLEARPAMSPANVPRSPEINPVTPAGVPKPPEAKPAAPPANVPRPTEARPATSANVPRSPEIKPVTPAGVPKPPEAKPAALAPNPPVAGPAPPRPAPPPPKAQEPVHQQAVPPPHEAPKPAEKKDEKNSEGR